MLSLSLLSQDEALRKAVADCLKKSKAKKVESKPAGRKVVRRRQRAEKVDWAQVASLFPKRGGAECKVRFEALTGIQTVVAQWTEAEDQKVVKLVKVHGTSYMEFHR